MYSWCFISTVLDTLIFFNAAYNFVLEHIAPRILAQTKKRPKAICMISHDHVTMGLHKWLYLKQCAASLISCLFVIKQWSKLQIKCVLACIVYLFSLIKILVLFFHLSLHACCTKKKHLPVISKLYLTNLSTIWLTYLKISFHNQTFLNYILLIY